MANSTPNSNLTYWQHNLSLLHLADPAGNKQRQSRKYQPKFNSTTPQQIAWLSPTLSWPIIFVRWYSILVKFKYSIYANNGDNDDIGDYDGDGDDNGDYDGDDGDEEKDHWTKGLVGWDMVAPPTLMSHKTGNAKRIENHRHHLKITTTTWKLSHLHNNQKITIKITAPL